MSDQEREGRLIRAPVFLVGAERSGTTLLRLMLDHHPRIAFHHEFEFAVDRLPDGSGWPDLEGYHEYLATHRVFHDGRFTIDRSLPYPELVNDFLVQRRERAGKPVVGATVHKHFDRLVRIWPDARFIHLLRDGRDVGRSCMAMGWASNIWTGVERWLEAEGLWERFSSELPAERKLDVKYEELVAEPEATLERVCRFIGVDYDTAMLDYHKNSTYEPVTPKLMGQWRTKLSEGEVRLAESRIGSMLVSRGYEPSGLPPLHVSGARRMLLRVHDRWWRRMRGVRKYGLRNVVEGAVARRCGLRRWWDRVQLRRNAIDAKYVR